VLLLLEAQRIQDGFQWHYALARLSVMQLRVKHREQLVWSAEKISSPYARPDEAYTIFEKDLSE
jgi:hypothetical protein